MDDVECISYRESGFFSNLICDYLDQSEQLKPFYGLFPTIENFEAQIAGKSAFPESRRALLADQLLSQYQRISESKVSFEAVNQNIEKLRSLKTFTITTGHQLNVFTGPLYFIYKIVSAVNLCEQLKSRYPDFDFVPVYWMATEDHDFAEINHINYFGGRISWNRDASGPVGRLSTDGMDQVISELEAALGPGTNSEYLIDLFKRAYLQHSTLADATRYMVHELFAEKGLVIVDGDDAALKAVMKPYFEKELLDQTSYDRVRSQSEDLAKSYFEQVHAREINLFYIQDGLRERIERTGERWDVLNTDISWAREELLEELNSNPERFSPNVILRPLYQEVILPNLAYIGGGGELAYWFQLRSVFQSFEVAFPMLVLRNSVQWISGKQSRKLDKTELSIGDMFQPLHHLEKKIVEKVSELDLELEPHELELKRMFDDLEEVARLTDKSMLGAVNAQRQKQLNGLEKLRKRLLKAEKRQHSEKVEMVRRLYDSMFPGGGLEERFDNFSIPYKDLGPQLFEKLYKACKPLDFQYTIIRSEQ